MKRIPLTQGKFALVDDQDYSRLLNYKWRAFQNHGRGQTWYAVRHIGCGAARRTCYMHRMIMGNPTEDVDHRNLNGLDNRRHNLRLASDSLNQANTRRRRTNTSGYKGVQQYWPGRWRMSVTRNGVRRWVSGFCSAYAAARAYKQLARQTFGEFART